MNMRKLIEMFVEHPMRLALGFVGGFVGSALGGGWLLITFLALVGYTVGLVLISLAKAWWKSRT